MLPIQDFLYKNNQIWKEHVHFYTDQIEHANVYQKKIYEDACAMLATNDLDTILASDNILLKKIKYDIEDYAYIKNKKVIRTDKFSILFPFLSNIDTIDPEFRPREREAFIRTVAGKKRTYAGIGKTDFERWYTWTEAEKTSFERWYNQQDLLVLDVYAICNYLPDNFALLEPKHYPTLHKMLYKHRWDNNAKIINRYLKVPAFAQSLQTYAKTRTLLESSINYEMMSLLDSALNIQTFQEWKHFASSAMVCDYWDATNSWTPTRVDEMMSCLAIENHTVMAERIKNNPSIRIHFVQKTYMEMSSWLCYSLRTDSISNNKKYYSYTFPTFSIKFEESSLEFLLHVYLKSRSNKAEWGVLLFEDGDMHCMKKSVSISEIHATERRVIDYLENQLGIDLSALQVAASLLYPTKEYKDFNKRRQLIVQYALNQQNHFIPSEEELLL